MNTNVITLDVFPGIQDSKVIEKILGNPELKGVILRAYGVGNIPTNLKFLNLIKKISQEKVVVIVTQCSKGTVELGLYETSQLLLDRGIIGGFDITEEAALCKLMLLLGEYEDANIVKDLMQKSIAGEQSYSLYSTTFEETGRLDKNTPHHIFNSKKLNSIRDTKEIEKVMLRFHDYTINMSIKNKTTFELFYEPENPEDMNSSSSQKIGIYEKQLSINDEIIMDDDTGQSLSFDITKIKDLLYTKDTDSPMHRDRTISFGLKTAFQEDEIFAWKKVDLNIFVREI